MSAPAVRFFCYELVQPCVLLVRPLPRPESFAALAGSWDDGRWECAARLEPADDTLLPEGAGAADTGPPSATTRAASLAVTTASVGATDIGTVRQENQDALLLNESNRLWAVADGDRFLLCSDGLYDVLDGASIARTIAQGTPDGASHALIEAAQAAGASDNVTAVFVDACSEKS